MNPLAKERLKIVIIFLVGTTIFTTGFGEIIWASARPPGVEVESGSWLGWMLFLALFQLLVGFIIVGYSFQLFKRAPLKAGWIEKYQYGKPFRSFESVKYPEEVESAEEEKRLHPD